MTQRDRDMAAHRFDPDDAQVISNPLEPSACDCLFTADKLLSPVSKYSLVIMQGNGGIP